MAIDKGKVRAFWEKQAGKRSWLAPESIATLEEDQERLKAKLRLEVEKVFSWLSLSRDARVLDLGAGTGQWALRFAPLVRQVTAVEYVPELLEIGRQDALAREIANVSFVQAAAEDFETDERFDLIFLSGLLIYLDDVSVRELTSRLTAYSAPGARVMLRDATGLQQRFEIDDRFSDNLNANYSATYRTRQDYLDLFVSAGWNLVRDEDMFGPDCTLNRWSETRLRLYLFEKPMRPTSIKPGQ